MQARGRPGAGRRRAARIADAATTAFVDSLNHIILIGAVIAFAAGVLSLLLIRQQDFVVHGGPAQAGAGGGRARTTTPTARTTLRARTTSRCPPALPHRAGRDCTPPAQSNAGRQHLA